MLAEERVREGDLGGALEDLQSHVRKAPGDAKLRVFLFQLLAVMGQWDRALTQLKVAGDLDPATLPMVQTYREALRCEVLRAQVFAGKKTPLIFGEPEEWIALLVEALRLAGQGDSDGAASLRARAFDAAPASKGTVDGQPFEWIADGDLRLGPTMEAIINGRYYFVPIHRLQSVRMEAPEDLRDLVWMPAVLTLGTGAETVAFIPTRYPGSEASADTSIVTSRRTEWTAVGDGFVGLGQRVFVTDASEVALMDLREIDIAAAGTEPSESASES